MTFDLRMRVMTWLRFRLRATLPFALACTVGAPARASDGGLSCNASADCVAPTPYCNPSSHACVECLGDRNCPTDRVCDTASGACKGCLSDADCGGDKPYCDASKSLCVECLSTVNCRNIGVSCVDGTCGSCGDGICSPKEGLYFESPFNPFGGPAPAPTGTVCGADCAQFCPTKDIGNTLGTFTVSGAELRNLFEYSCSNGVDGVDATFAWTAPRDDTFAFSAVGTAISVIHGSCTDLTGFGGCSASDIAGLDSGPARAETNVALSKGDQVVVVVDTGVASVSSVKLQISKGTPQCGLFGCPPPPAGDGGTEGGNDQGATLCLNNAQGRGEELCDGVNCVCHHCPQDYDDCAVIPGCSDVRKCMQDKNCVATECYNSGACRSVIDSFGGVSGPAFSTSAHVQSCELTFACKLPCGTDGGAEEGGASHADAGRLCAPGRKIACACEGGTGAKTCAADGNGYGACSCAVAPAPASGCDCEIGGTTSTRGGDLAFAVGLAAATTVFARRTRKSRKERLG